MARLLIVDELPIRVTKRGEWLHGTEPLHPRVRELFQKNIVPRDDGRYMVKLGFNEQVLEVDDTPYDVRHMRFEENDAALLAVRFTTSDAQDELLDVTTLMQGNDNTLYCGVRRAGFLVPCRFTSAQYHALALHMEMTGETAELRVGDACGVVKAFSPAPRRLA